MTTKMWHLRRLRMGWLQGKEAVKTTNHSVGKTRVLSDVKVSKKEVRSSALHRAHSWAELWSSLITPFNLCLCTTSVQAASVLCLMSLSFVLTFIFHSFWFPLICGLTDLTFYDLIVFLSWHTDYAFEKHISLVVLEFTCTFTTNLFQTLLGWFMGYELVMPLLYDKKKVVIHSPGLMHHWYYSLQLYISIYMHSCGCVRNSIHCSVLLNELGDHLWIKWMGLSIGSHFFLLQYFFFSEWSCEFLTYVSLFLLKEPPLILRVK